MRGLGNDFKAAPLSTFDIVYEKSGKFVLFQVKEGQCDNGEQRKDKEMRHYKQSI